MYIEQEMKRELEKTLLEADLESAWLGLVQAVDRIGAAADRTKGSEKKIFLRVRDNLLQTEYLLHSNFGCRRKLKSVIRVEVTHI